MLLATAGCAEIRWRSYHFELGAAEAQREGRPMLVYLRNWYMPDCTAFEDSVLRSAPVIKAAEGFYAIMLEADLSPEQTKAWTVPGAPAVVTLSPDRKLLGRRSGRMTVADIVSLLEAARPKPAATAPAGGGQTQPAPQDP